MSGNRLPQRLGIVAGGGFLPAKLLAFCDAHNIEPFIIAFERQTDPAILPGRNHAVMRLGQAGRMIGLLKDRKITDLVLIGSIRRPRPWDLRPDLYTASFFARMGFRALGDDGLLKAIRQALEEEGFVIHGIHELMPELLMPHGILSMRIPNQDEQKTIALGFDAAIALGEADIGQAVLVKDGVVIGREDSHGTNHLIKSRGVKGAILVKTCKPQQDRKLDLPTIGSHTVRLCAEQEFAGIAVEAGDALLVDREETVLLADQAGLFVVGI